MRPDRAAALALAAFLFVSPAVDGAAGPAPFLRDALGLTAADLARAASGEVVAHTQPSDDRREVATLGVARVRITPGFYIERLADIAEFKKDEDVLQIGTFGDPPAVDDVSDLTLDDSDIRSLRRCRAGDCDVQLSAGAIGRFGREVDWDAPGAPAQANALMRRILVEYVAGYMRGGNAVLMQYADQAEPIDLRREFASLVDSGASVLRDFPALRRHLSEYPAAGTPDARDVIYWSKEKVGRRTVVSVTHLAMVRIGGGSAVEYVAASKHIYGTHYFEASLGLTMLLPDPAAEEPSLYLAYANRSRVDTFDGLFGGLLRKIVRSRARSAVSDQLTRIQRVLERDFAASRTD